MVAAVIIRIMKLAWETYLGALSRINAILIPRISAHPPILAQCKVHRPWALFREGTVYVTRIRKMLISYIRLDHTLYSINYGIHKLFHSLLRSMITNDINFVLEA